MALCGPVCLRDAYHAYFTVCSNFIVIFFEIQEQLHLLRYTL